MAKTEIKESSGISALQIVAATDADAPDVIALIAACFAEYPGCVMDLGGLDADLLHVATRFHEQGGEFWVIRDGGRLVGCAGYTPAADGGIELKRMYVDAGMRRCGIASGLLCRILQAARRRNAGSVVLWSDTRFENAHRFYRRHGFSPTGRMRDLNDPSHTTEYEFRLQLGAMEQEPADTETPEN